MTNDFETLHPPSEPHHRRINYERWYQTSPPPQDAETPARLEQVASAGLTGRDGTRQ